MTVSAIRLKDVDPALLSPVLHLPSGPASWCWFLREEEGPVLAIVPDLQRMTEFVSDWQTLFPERNLLVLSEIPLTQDHFSNDALRIERGYTAKAWKEKGGCMVSTAPGILAPVLLPSDSVDISPGVRHGRDEFLEWASRSGYRRSDLVWQEGQFVSRGSIVDIFDPSYRYPLRVEFFDDNVESIHLLTRKARGAYRLWGLPGCFHFGRYSGRIHRNDPPWTKVIFFEPAGLDRSAEAYSWIWDRMALERGQPALASWEQVKSQLRSLRSYSVTRISPGPMSGFRSWNCLFQGQTGSSRIPYAGLAG